MLLNEELFDAAVEIPVAFPQIGANSKISFNPMEEVSTVEDEFDGDYSDDKDDEIIIASPSSITDAQQDKLAASAILTDLIALTFDNIQQLNVMMAEMDDSQRASLRGVLQDVLNAEYESVSKLETALGVTNDTVTPSEDNEYYSDDEEMSNVYDYDTVSCDDDSDTCDVGKVKEANAMFESLLYDDNNVGNQSSDLVDVMAKLWE